jgi:type II secretory pathway component GspD/PulD (secretin)
VTAQFVVQTQAAVPATAAPTSTPQPVPDANQPAPTTNAAAEAADNPSSVHVIPNDEGDEMIILSRDPEAAEAAKQLVEQIVPDRPEVEIITLKHAQAAQVKFQLDSILGVNLYTTTTSSLDTSKRISIEADSRINRLVIQHASAKQMELIHELIPVLDQPTQEDERLVRQQRVYRAQRKRAAEIVEVVKEVYRDVLSTNDKVFDARISNQPFGYNRAMAATSRSPEYQGLLSVGADDEGNLVVLSAPAYLMEEVYQLVERIDATGAGEKMVVVPVSRAARDTVSQALGRLLAKQPGQ